MGFHSWASFLTCLFIAQTSDAVEEILDLENKRMTDSLASKVIRLKSVSSGFFPAFHLHLKGLRGGAEDLEEC